MAYDPNSKTGTAEAKDKDITAVIASGSGTIMGGKGSASAPGSTPAGGPIDPESKNWRNRVGGGGDQCATGATIDNGKYTCSGTNTWVKASQVIDMTGQIAGQAAVQYSGMRGQMTAMSQGTQSAAYKAAASTARVSGYKDAALGTVNLVMGAKQMQLGAKHGNNAEELSKPSGTVRQNIVKNLQIDERDENSIRAAGNQAAGEQKSTSEVAKAQGMITMIKAAQQHASATFALMSAAELDKAANDMNKVENTPVFGGGPEAPKADAAGTDLAAIQNGDVITGNGQGETAAVSAEEEIKDVAGPLGRPIGMPGKNTIDGAPAPGKFGEKLAQNGPGGGGGGGSGGGSTSAATGESNDAAPRLADNKTGTNYESGGTFVGGGGGGGKGADGGPDLSGLLAQFLPKKEDELSKNGIMEFGSRGPAGEAPLSLLDKNANIFQRIHETYQDKNRQKAVGMF